MRFLYSPPWKWRRLGYQTILIMNLLSTLLLAACLQVSASGLSQTVSYTGTNQSLEKVFAEVEHQTGYVFFFEETTLQNARTVTLKTNAMPLNPFLELLFRNQPLSWSIQGRTIVISRKQDVRNAGNTEKDPAPPEVKGRIVNDAGEGIVATITEKGTKNATSSDASGSFILRNVGDEATLVITGVNIETREVKLKGRASLDIPVKTKIVSGDPVTITAYGIERKTKEIGYSVAKVSGTEINKANSGNLLTGLIGKVSGLNITTQSSDMSPQMRILLRGIRSFGQNSSNQPLFIFNGAPISFGTDQVAANQVMEFINNFNPSDIEDVTILKGANGTALYGPEGVNGVIIITTKKAAKGAPVINFRNNNSFQVLDFRQDQRQREYGLGSGAVDADGNGIYDPRATGSWGPKFDGSLVPIGYPDENGDLQQVTYTPRKDVRKFYNTGFVNRTNLSFSQADATSSYYLGLGYTEIRGLLPGDKQNQLNALFSSSKKFGNKLNIQYNINYSRVNNDKGPEIEVRTTASYIPLLEYKDYKNSYWGNHNRYYSYISPYEQLATARTKSTSNALNGSLIFEIKPLEWLTIREQPGINYSGYYHKFTSEPISFLEFARLDFRKSGDRSPALGEQISSNTSLNNDFIVSAIHKQNDFLFRINAGNTIRQNYTKLMKGGGYLVAPVYNLGFGLPGTRSEEDAILSRTISAFGTASAGYKETIFLEVTSRNEWDSKRAKVARGKDFYASANTSLILNNLLPGLKNISWLSVARLRASLAKSANMNISPYQSERILYLASGYPYVDPNSGNSVISYSFLLNNPNPFLKPEKITSQEYGLNLGLFDNRIVADVTYYRQLNNSVILDVVNSFLSGYPTTDNAGSFRNQGWEFDINLNPLFSTGGGVTVGMQLRGALNSNKVVSLAPVYNGLFPVADPSGQRYYARTGHGAYEFAVTDWKRDPEGRIIVDNVTGYPIPEDFGTYKTAGNTLPKYSASVGFNVSWKRFTASVFADYMGGFDHLFTASGDLYSGMDPRTTYNNRQPYVFPNSVYDDGTGKYIENTTLKTQTANLDLYSNLAQVTGYGLSSASFLKIREVAFQYNLPVRSDMLKELQFSVYGRDLFSFYPKSNIWGDPGLIRGPGFRDPVDRQSNIASQGSQDFNTIGGSSESTALPGTVLFGFTVSAIF